MRAVVVREPGGPDVLEVRERPAPEVSPSHVRVRVAFAGVNRADLLQRMGRYPAPPGSPADIPGLEYSGAVDGVGEGVTRVREGDRVYGLVGGGAYASMLVAHEREVVKIPEGVSDEQAAAVPEAFVTAYDALVVRGRARPGERVLVHAAGSGVGTAAVQLARALGCFVVGTSRTADKLDRCRALGMDRGIAAIDGEFAKAVRDATNGEGVDVVIDLVGGAYVSRSLAACAPRGRVVVVGLTAGAAAEIDLASLLSRRLEVVGTSLRSRPIEEKIEAAKLLDREIGAFLARGAVKAVVDRVFFLDEAGAAHAHVASNQTFGKVLLRV